jgi:ubiquitin carboxyl-terminal hydrolase 7
LFEESANKFCIF